MNLLLLISQSHYYANNYCDQKNKLSKILYRCCLLWSVDNEESIDKEAISYDYICFWCRLITLRDASVLYLLIEKVSMHYICLNDQYNMQKQGPTELT